MDLTGKTALVTGGGSGIGLGIARALVEQGVRVVIAGRTASRLEEAAASMTKGAIACQVCDVADRAAVDEMFAWINANLGPLDILVNSAGINIPNRSLSDMEPGEWDRVLGVNVTGTYNCIHAALPGMRQKGDALIVNISSVAGKRALKFAGVAYCASKFAMTALGTCVGLEEHDRGIRVTNIYPGEVNTPIMQQRPQPVPEERLAQMLMPEDIAELVVTIARLPQRAHVAEVVVTPLYQEYA